MYDIRQLYVLRQRKNTLYHFIFTVADSKTKITCLLPVHISRLRQSHEQSSASPVLKPGLYSRCPHHPLQRYSRIPMSSFNMGDITCACYKMFLRKILFQKQLVLIQPLVLTEMFRLMVTMEFRSQIP